MELPDSIKTLGEQVEAGGEITPAVELFDAYPVFAAEVAQLFTRPWLAVDHVSRLACDGDYFRAEVGSRSIVLVREASNRIHALRNACLHAGYRVCEEESGRSDHLFCQYHGWSYALDGRLTDPQLRPELTDRSRFRLPHYAMRIERGLILVDLSTLAPEHAGAKPPASSASGQSGQRPEEGGAKPSGAPQAPGAGPAPGHEPQRAAPPQSGQGSSAAPAATPHQPAPNAQRPNAPNAPGARPPGQSSEQGDKEKKER